MAPEPAGIARVDEHPAAFGERVKIVGGPALHSNLQHGAGEPRRVRMLPVSAPRTAERVKGVRFGHTSAGARALKLGPTGGTKVTTACEDEARPGRLSARRTYRGGRAVSGLQATGGGRHAGASGRRWWGGARRGRRGDIREEADGDDVRACMAGMVALRAGAKAAARARAAQSAGGAERSAPTAPWRGGVR
jgi:hypothetical protein